MNSFQLKCIAILTMVIDHVGAILYPGEEIFRIIGRLSFPIFCFLIVEGFYHTSNIQKYIIRLGIFALISEIPYDFAFYKTPFMWDRQNVFFTLCIGVIMLYLMERSGEIALKLIYMLLCVWTAGILSCDYAERGVLLIFLFYILHDFKWPSLGFAALWNLLLYKGVQRYGAIASLVLATYNGERGPSMKYFFYVFYPAHLLVLYFVWRMRLSV